MSNNRWARIEELFHAAADLAPAERAAFLERACATDAELRRQVESLLAQDAPKDNIFEAAIGKAAGQLPDDSDNENVVLVGKQIGPYVITELIGKGGMGMVFKAHDTSLRRDVAIKVLPTGLVHDTERLSRFQREARMLASLNHPNIATIHGLEQSGGTHYLVMELVQGEMLAERISKGALPLKQALNVAGQIAEAIEAAHEKGVIHRDLKPANVMVTEEGRVKVLDFGLAKALADDSGGSLYEPTLTLGTEDGRILGTPGYMSPEQARGKIVDKRTDIWGFGCVFYEILSGRMAFRGETAQDTIVSVLEREPDWQALPLGTPVKIRDLLRRCLQKDSQRRLHDIVDARIEIEETQRSTSHAASDLLFRKIKRPRIFVPLILALLFVAGTVAVVIRLAAGGWLFYPRKTHALSETDTIVLADFANSTGEAVFDDTLKQALATELQQSPFLNVLPDQKVGEILKLMGRSADQRLDANSALDLCRRSGAKAVLEGSIASLGSEYVIGLNVMNCQTGGSLAREEVQATKKEKVLQALEKATTKLREKLGESLRSVQKFDTPLEQATTPSLEALQAYSLGWKNRGPDTWRAALPAYQRAIQLDPKFAIAYAALGQLYTNIGKRDLAMENLQKAYDLRDRVSDRERFYIESHYYHHFSGDLEKARQVYELWKQSYPRDSLPPFTLRWIYADLGQHDKALSEARENLRLDPKIESYVYLVISFLSLNRLGEARATAEEALAKELDDPGLHYYLYGLAFLQNDATGMAQQVTWFSGKSAWEATLLFQQAATAAYFGRLAQAREFHRRAVALTGAVNEADTVEQEALIGNIAKARQALAAATLSKPTSPYGQYSAAMALALAEDTVGAQTLVDDLAKRFPEDTLVQFVYLPTIRAQLALDRKDASKAIESLQAARAYELGFPARLFPVYMRGKAYLAAHQGSEAAREFQTILDHPGVVSNEITAALAHLGVARAYALAGDAAKAHAAYQDFLTLWKEADPDIPILEQAKAEYAKLK